MAKKRPGRKVSSQLAGSPLNYPGTMNGVGKMIGTISRKVAGRIKMPAGHLDRKITRLNSSHRCISYAVFCLKKKKKKKITNNKYKIKMMLKREIMYKIKKRNIVQMY